jgi:hypothetical protein
MSVEISFGGTCRDIGLLPKDEGELRAFFDNYLGPAIFEDFKKNIIMANSADLTRAFPGVVAERGCEVSGSVSIKF